MVIRSHHQNQALSNCLLRHHLQHALHSNTTINTTEARLHRLYLNHEVATSSAEVRVATSIPCRSHDHLGLTMPVVVANRISACSSLNSAVATRAMVLRVAKVVVVDRITATDKAAD